MQITTSWMRQGLEQGLEREKTLIIRQLKRKLGDIGATLEARVMALLIDDLETLGEALLDFSSIEDLQQWLSDRESYSKLRSNQLQTKPSNWLKT